MISEYPERLTVGMRSGEKFDILFESVDDIDDGLFMTATTVEGKRCMLRYDAIESVSDCEVTA